MTALETDDPGEGEESSQLAQLSEQVTRLLQAGEPLCGDTLQDQYPLDSGSIRELLPTLQDLVELGRSLRQNRQIRPSGHIPHQH